MLKSNISHVEYVCVGHTPRLSKWRRTESSIVALNGEVHYYGRTRVQSHHKCTIVPFRPSLENTLRLSTTAAPQHILAIVCKAYHIKQTKTFSLTLCVCVCLLYSTNNHIVLYKE